MNPRSENPKEEGPYAWQARDAALLAGKLGINAYAVYHALTHFQSMAASEHKRRFAASYDQLAEYLQCSTKTVQRCLADLKKAGLVRIFSGANGSNRNTRNAFFLTSVNRDYKSRRRDYKSTSPKDCESTSPKDYKSHLNKKENSYSAPEALGVTENGEKQPTRQPLGAGSGPQRTQTDQPASTEDVPAWILMRNAMFEESERLIAEKKKLDEQRNH